RQKSFHRGPVHVGPGEAAVVVPVGHHRPAIVALAGYIRLSGLALGIECVEFLVETLLGRFPSVYGGPDLFRCSGGHGEALRISGHGHLPWRARRRRTRSTSFPKSRL